MSAIAANLRLRNLILQQGPDALPRPPASKSRIAPPADLNIPGLSPWMRMQLEKNL